MPCKAVAHMSQVSIGGLRALYDSLVVVSVIDLDIYRTFTCIVSLLRAS